KVWRLPVFEPKSGDYQYLNQSLATSATEISIDQLQAAFLVTELMSLLACNSDSRSSPERELRKATSAPRTSANSRFM
ncbi:MAG: hypothetical protein O2856_12330, partial [Planctomycetota bacterium]|nr:hypothetical protein [Planctomycetota bacterium]